MNIGKYLQMYSEDLEVKNYSKSTIENYVSQVGCFLNNFNLIATKPSEINERQIKEWLLDAKTINSRKHRISAVKLFYSLTGKQPLKFKHIEYPRSDKKLPIVLSVDEVQKMFSVCSNLKHTVILALLYSGGFRRSELVNLRWEHIDKSRMIINVIQGKGKKDRQVTLCASIVPLLDRYKDEYNTTSFVLAGQFGEQYTGRSIEAVIKQLAEKAQINKKATPHLIRHCYATHLFEAGTDILLLQRLLGHSSAKTTAIYTHISHNFISKVKTPTTAIVFNC